MLFELLKMTQDFFGIIYPSPDYLMSEDNSINNHGHDDRSTVYLL